jgi:HSP20 family protein
MSIVRFDPFEEMGTLRRAMDRMLEDFFTGRRPLNGPAGQGVLAWEPAVEMYETDGEVVVKAELPNIDPKQVDITVTNDAITVKGETRQEEEKKGRNYYRRELRYGTFTRTLPLLTEVKSAEAKATYKDGVLEVKIPKSERVKPTSVKVQIG